MKLKDYRKIGLEAIANASQKKASASESVAPAATTQAEKPAQPAVKQPTEAELRRMYDVIQADANLTSRLAGLGFGRTGDSYRKAAIKLQILSLMNVLRDGKNIRNDIVHKPGYIPSEQSAARALQEYANADGDITRYLQEKTRK